MSGGSTNGSKYINGSWGELWWDGEKVVGLEGFKFTITPEREDVYGDGLDIDSKVVAIKVEGDFTVGKLYSRAVDKLVKAWVKGIDPRARLVIKLADPDSRGIERFTLNNVWFNDTAVLDFAKKKVVKESYKFGCTISGVQFNELITKKVV